MMSYFRENIEKIAGYTPGFQPDSTDVVKLNTNENPYPPSPRVIEAIRNIGPESLRRYPQPLGNEFRRAAGKVLGVPEEYIMCTNGGDDLLTICFRALCDDNRAVAYPEPTYSLYPVLADLQGCSTIEIPYESDDLIEELAGTGAALTIICNPNAPTGAFFDVGRMAKLAGKLTGVLLVDEAYVDFADDNCLRLVEDFENIIILRSMSKGYSLAGIRFGYAVAKPAIINELVKVKDSYNVDAMATTAAAAAIGDQEYFRQNIEKIISERKKLTSELKSLGFNVSDSSANFILAECSDRDAAGIYDKLAQKNIYVRYFDLPGLSDKLRVTVGTEAQNEILICALKEICGN